MYDETSGLKPDLPRPLYRADPVRCMSAKHNYARHLPHVVPEGAPIFVTWNLKGAMPQSAIEARRRKRRSLERQALRPGETAGHRKERENKILFALADRFLDNAVDGPMHMRDAEAARIVEERIRAGSGPDYDLFARCVMSNHVHVLLKARGELKEVTHRIKGSTAFKINGLQNKRGRVFWQDESYDHWVRDEAELFRIIAYIENNPVAAGLCHRPEDWRWSSARFRKNWPAGEIYVGKEQSEDTRMPD
jgi:REP element-mobilizing transposase RayT